MPLKISRRFKDKHAGTEFCYILGGPHENIRVTHDGDDYAGSYMIIEQRNQRIFLENDEWEALLQARKLLNL